MKTVSTYNKFGSLLKELIETVNTTNDWEQYVDDKSKKVINELLTIQNINQIAEINDIAYTTLRAKYALALDRIKNKNTKFIRNGKSEKAQYLFELIKETPNWKEELSNTEIKYIEKFKELKNFHEVGKALNVKPSNIVGKLYGTTQRKGVIQKLEKIKNDKLVH